MHKSQCEQIGSYGLMGVGFGSQTYTWAYLRYLNPLFDQGLIMIPQGMLLIHQNSKVAKLGFLQEKSTKL